MLGSDLNCPRGVSLCCLSFIYPSGSSLRVQQIQSLNLEEYREKKGWQGADFKVIVWKEATITKELQLDSDFRSRGRRRRWNLDKYVQSSGAHKYSECKPSSPFPSGGAFSCSQSYRKGWHLHASPASACPPLEDFSADRSGFSPLPLFKICHLTISKLRIINGYSLGSNRSGNSCSSCAKLST